jgi:DNA-binding response OmpR family regulator
MSAPSEPRVAVVIEDDDDIRHLLETVLSQAGFRVFAAANGQDGVEAVRANDPIVTTLDVNMPGMDGFEVARRIRVFSDTYIVMLTALNEEIDTLQGLEAGADDYVNKPFRPRELRARIEAMLRRPRTVRDRPDDEQPPANAPATSPDALRPPHPPAPTSQPVPGATQLSSEQPYGVPGLPPQPPSWEQQAPGAPAGSAATAPGRGTGWLAHNGLWLNVETRTVQSGTTEIDLSRSEFDLLAGLLQSDRRVRTKADLVLLLRGESYVTSHFISEADKRAVEVHMGSLRKKLGDTSSTSPRWIETVRGVGYRLTVGED